MDDRRAVDVLLLGFRDADELAMESALRLLGRSASAGDPINDATARFVFAAAYDESELRSHRAGAVDDERPWCFCVSQADRHLVAAASFAHEGWLALLPPEGRELKRVLSAMAEEAVERSSGDAAFSGLQTFRASFSWTSSSFDVSRVSRRIAVFLAEAGFYEGRSEMDECALALEEAFVNSLEHGNLELDSALRPADALAEDLYEREKARRLADPAYGNRRVGLELGIEGAEAKLVLEDEGAGFDVSKLDDEPSGLEVSGKGFWLIKKPFDSAAYNSKGNALTLTRRRPTAPPGAR